MSVYTKEQYQEFEDNMYLKFPKIFQTPRGFEIGSGWWHIVESLCANIQNHIDWKNIQKEKYDRGEGCEQVVVAQIKEKFGGLRFYYDGGDEYISGMVRMAESWAGNTCEKCGSPGKLRTGGWIRTLCDAHEEIHQQSVK